MVLQKQKPNRHDKQENNKATAEKKLTPACIKTTKPPKKCFMQVFLYLCLKRKILVLRF
jgi:hypothetical protein